MEAVYINLPLHRYFNCGSISCVLYFITCEVNIILYYIVYYTLWYWNSLISFALERKCIVNKILHLWTMDEVGFLKYFHLGLLELFNHFNVKKMFKILWSPCENSGVHKVRSGRRILYCGDSYLWVINMNFFFVNFLARGILAWFLDFLENLCTLYTNLHGITFQLPIIFKFTNTKSSKFSNRYFG
jgi:hypothetical protein